MPPFLMNKAILCWILFVQKPLMQESVHVIACRVNKWHTCLQSKHGAALSPANVGGDLRGGVSAAAQQMIRRKET